jgi:endo-1,4-beta-xylanase
MKLLHPLRAASTLPALAFVILSAPLVARLAAAESATWPAPRVVPVLPANTVPNGPPIPASAPAESAHPAPIALWPNGAPGSETRKDEPEQVSYRQEPDIVFPVVFNIQNPSITPFLPAKGKATGAAVIIAPGGGHMFLTIDREGYDLAKWLADRGIAAFVLKYRLARDQSGEGSTYKTNVEPVADGQRAIRLVRSRAAEWGVNPHHIGILGFSAGGAPALGSALHFDQGNPAAADAVERQSSRPDFHALIYAEVPRGDIEVPKDAPPAFFTVAFDDTPKVGALANLFLKYKAANVPTEVHIYNRGGHGFGVRTDRPEMPISTWPARLVDWLGDTGMLKN